MEPHLRRHAAHLGAGDFFPIGVGHRISILHSLARDAFVDAACELLGRIVALQFHQVISRRHFNSFTTRSIGLTSRVEATPNKSLISTMPIPRSSMWCRNRSLE